MTPSGARIGFHARVGQARLRDSEETERRALDEWEQAVRGLNPGLAVDEMGELRDDLDA